MYYQQQRFSTVFRLVSVSVLFSFLTVASLPPQLADAQVLNLPLPGALLTPTSGFSPMMMKGMNIHPDNPLKLDFIMDRGDTDYSDIIFKNESQKLIKYFMASLTIPETAMWVNLSPYEKNRIIPEGFGTTELGRDLLAQDYMLKQFSSSLMHPDESVGEEFWARVYNKAQEKYGTTDIPMNTFNKIWIVPQKAQVYEHEKGAVVVDSYLKVMLEEDYVALEANQGSALHGLSELGLKDMEVVSGVTSDIVRDILIPEIEKEVNQGKIFSNLRQIYNTVILASWYKSALKGSFLDQVYINQEKTVGVDYEDKHMNQKIYDQYVESFEVGAYDFVKEDYDPSSGNIVSRKYFSGGVIQNVTEVEKISFEKNQTMLNDLDKVEIVEAELIDAATVIMGKKITEKYHQAIVGTDIDSLLKNHPILNILSEEFNDVLANIRLEQIRGDGMKLIVRVVSEENMLPLLFKKELDVVDLARKVRNIVRKKFPQYIVNVGEKEYIGSEYSVESFEAFEALEISLLLLPRNNYSSTVDLTAKSVGDAIRTFVNKDEGIKVVVDDDKNVIISFSDGVRMIPFLKKLLSLQIAEKSLQIANHLENKWSNLQTNIGDIIEENNVVSIKISLTDSAESVTDDFVQGGIDMNPLLNNVTVEGHKVIMPRFDRPVDMLNMRGLVPVILNISTPVNMPLLIGLNTDVTDDVNNRVKDDFDLYAKLDWCIFKLGKFILC